MLRVVLIGLGVLVAVVLAGLAIGAVRWRRGTAQLRAALDASLQPPPVATYDPAELEGLPAPVQRYLRLALTPGQAIVAAADITCRGTFAMQESGPISWSPFTSTERAVMHRPGFDWDGRIRIVPGLDVHVHDAYVNGEGILHAAIGGLITLADLRGSRETALGELYRFLAESPWYPTRLLPSGGVRWTPVNDTAADATLSDGDLSVTIRFFFGEDGLVSRVRAEARGRTVQGRTVPTPWEGRWWSYAERDGMRIPLEGEVAWVVEEGVRPYWRGRVTGVRYQRVGVALARGASGGG